MAKPGRPKKTLQSELIDKLNGRFITIFMKPTPNGETVLPSLRIMAEKDWTFEDFKDKAFSFIIERETPNQDVVMISLLDSDLILDDLMEIAKEYIDYNVDLKDKQEKFAKLVSEKEEAFKRDLEKLKSEVLGTPKKRKVKSEVITPPKSKGKSEPTKVRSVVESKEPPCLQKICVPLTFWIR